MNELELIQPKGKYSSLIEYNYCQEEYQDNEDIEKQLVVKDEINFITIENIIKEDSRNIHICKLRNKYKYQLNYSISYDNNYTAILINVKVEDKKGYENGTIIIECKHIYNFLRTLKAILYNLKDTDIHYKTIKEIAEMYITDLNYDNFLKYYYIVNQIALATGIFIYPKQEEEFNIFKGATIIEVFENEKPNIILIPKRTISKIGYNLCPLIDNDTMEKYFDIIYTIKLFEDFTFEDFKKLLTKEVMKPYEAPIKIIGKLKDLGKMFNSLQISKYINNGCMAQLLEKIKAFEYKGKLLTADQIKDAKKGMDTGIFEAITKYPNPKTT